MGVGVSQPRRTMGGGRHNRHHRCVMGAPSICLSCTYGTKGKGHCAGMHVLSVGDCTKCKCGQQQVRGMASPCVGVERGTSACVGVERGTSAQGFKCYFQSVLLFGVN